MRTVPRLVPMRTVPRLVPIRTVPRLVPTTSGVKSFTFVAAGVDDITKDKINELSILFPI